MHKTEEQRLRHLEEMIEEIHAWMILGGERIPGKAEYDRAIRELLKGNSKPLELYKQRGGVIPKADPDCLQNRFRRCGGHVERPGVSGKPTEDRPGGGIVPKLATIYPTAAAQGGGTSRRMHTRNSKAPSLQDGVCGGPLAGSANLPPAAQPGRGRATNRDLRQSCAARSRGLRSLSGPVMLPETKEQRRVL